MSSCRPKALSVVPPVQVQPKPHLAVLDQRRLQLPQGLCWRVVLCQIVQEVQCALDLVLEVFSSRWGHAAASRRCEANCFSCYVGCMHLSWKP